MKKIVGLQVSAGMVAGLLIGTIYINLRKKKRSKITSLLLAQIDKTLSPDKGLEDEMALDVAYVDKVFNQLSGRVATLKKDTAILYANEIHKAFKPWYMGGDAEENVYAVLRNLKDKVQVSQVAKAYQSEQKLNLKDQLQNRFDSDEIKKALGIISKKPNYRTV